MGHQQEPVYQAFYSSVSTFVDNIAVDQDILRAARRKNGSSGLTGFLFRTKKHYFQLLEGPADGVEEVMDKIRYDSRHHGMREWTAHKAERRVFPDWNMGYGHYAEEEMIGAAFMFAKPKPIPEIADDLFELAQKRFFSE